MTLLPCGWQSPHSRVFGMPSASVENVGVSVEFPLGRYSLLK